MVNSYDDMAGGEPMNPVDHPSYNIPQATQHYAGDVIPLHPPGTFSSNTQSGDVINGMAKALGVKNPPNVIKFPSK